MIATLLSRLGGPYLAAALAIMAISFGVQTVRVAGVKSDLVAEKADRARAALAAAQAYSAELKRRDEEFAKAEAHAQQLGVAIAESDAHHLITKLERDDAIKRLTQRKPCLSADAVRLLNGGAANPAVPALQAPAGGQPDARADAGGAAATDTDVAFWISDARQRYAACAKRLSVWQDWYEGQP